jgi:hypothetical protein
MKNILPVIILVFFLQSCSNESSQNNDDFIVGKWEAIKRYKSNVEIELGICDPYMLYEFNQDNSSRLFNKSEKQPPNTFCGETMLGWNIWKNIGNGNYELHDRSGEISSTFYIDNSNLIEEYIDRDEKVVYKRVSR